MGRSSASLQFPGVPQQGAPGRRGSADPPRPSTGPGGAGRVGRGRPVESNALRACRSAVPGGPPAEGATRRGSARTPRPRQGPHRSDRSSGGSPWASKSGKSEKIQSPSRHGLSCGSAAPPLLERGPPAPSALWARTTEASRRSRGRAEVSPGRAEPERREAWSSVLSEIFLSPREDQGHCKSPRTGINHRGALELSRPRQSSRRSDWPSGSHTLDVWSPAQQSHWLSSPLPPSTR